MDIIDGSGLWSITSGVAAPPIPPVPPIVRIVGGLRKDNAFQTWFRRLYVLPFRKKVEDEEKRAIDVEEHLAEQRRLFEADIEDDDLEILTRM